MKNLIIKSIFFICVTVAAICFENASILWWYLLGLIIQTNYDIKKGV